MHGNDVYIAFDQNAAVLLRNRRLRLKEAVQTVFLYIYLRLRRVYVFAYPPVLEVGEESAAAESDDFAAVAVYGEYDPVVEAVIYPVVRSLYAYTRLYEIFGLVALFGSGVQERLTVRRAPAKAETAYGVVLHSAAAEIIVADGPALPFFQAGGVEVCGKLGGEIEAFALLPQPFHFVALLLFLYFHVIFGCQIAYGLDIAHILVLHQEIDGRAALVAAEAVVEAL